MPEIKTPVVIINFKTYPQATGEKSVTLAKVCQSVSHEYDVPIVVAPQISDLYRVVEAVDIPVFSQHMDPGEQGRFTGHVLGEALVEAGCSGTLLNHSENRMQLADVELAVTKARKLDLYTVVCTNNPAVSVAAATMTPDSVAVEPPELIGGDISVSKAQPELISDTVERVHRIDERIPVLCGAGIKDHEDVRIVMRLGCKGILVASGVTKAADPENALLDLIKGMG